MGQLFRTKPVDQILAQTEAHHASGGLKRALSALDLTALGIGAIIGTGIFVLTGTAAADKAGPALALSYVFAGLACIFSAFCYAEFASMLPIAGSAYTYAYATTGELMAWIIGWDLVLEYMIGASCVASGWSGHLNEFLRCFGLQVPGWLNYDYWTAAHMHPEIISQVPQLMGHPMVFNLPAALILLVITALLVVGIRESARFNSTIVVIKLLVVLFVIGAGFQYVKPENWTPFLPYGVGGIFAGAGTIFFAYIGFDAVSTAAEEAKNPQKDLPIGIMASLLVCTVLYILVTLILTGMVPYHLIDRSAPIAHAFAQIGINWAAYLVAAGALAGLTSVLLVLMLSQPRIFYAMSRDGLLPKWFAKVHPQFGTPANATVLTGVVVAIIAALTPIEVLSEMTSIGTLFAFCLVCLAVIILRVKSPDLPRTFKAPMVPLFPILGILCNLAMIIKLNPQTWLRLVVWLLVGLAIYGWYGFKHSRLNERSTQEEG